MVKELLKAAEIQVALVTGVCIIVSAILIKRVFHVQADQLLSNVPVYIFIIFLFVRGGTARNETKKSRWGNPLVWSIAIVIVTGAVILKYGV